MLYLPHLELGRQPGGQSSPGWRGKNIELWRKCWTSTAFERPNGMRRSFQILGGQVNAARYIEIGLRFERLGQFWPQDFARAQRYK
jgi:hypothetical protein